MRRSRRHRLVRMTARMDSRPAHGPYFADLLARMGPAVTCALAVVASAGGVRRAWGLLSPSNIAPRSPAVVFNSVSADFVRRSLQSPSGRVVHNSAAAPDVRNGSKAGIDRPINEGPFFPPRAVSVKSEPHPSSLSLSKGCPVLRASRPASR